MTIPIGAMAGHIDGVGPVGGAVGHVRLVGVLGPIEPAKESGRAVCRWGEIRKDPGRTG